MRVAAALALLALVLAGCAPPGPAEAAGLEGALAYLEGLRDEEGRWPAGLVPHLVEVADATGHDSRAWPEDLPLRDQFVMPADGGSLLPSLRALYAATLLHDADLADEAERRVLAAYDGAQFGDARLLNDDAFALTVLASTSASTPAMAASLRQNVSADGGWSWGVGGRGEADMTGMVLTALAGTSPGSVGLVDVASVRWFLDSTQTLDGGHSLEPGGDAGNCDSTVWAIRAHALLGGGDTRMAWAFLLGLQRDDGGFAYSPGGPSNTLCTMEVAVLLGLRDAGLLDDPWRR